MPTFRSAGTAVGASSGTTVVVTYDLAAGDRLFVMASEAMTVAATPTSVVSDLDGALSVIGAYEDVVGDFPRGLGLYELVGGQAGTHTITVTFPTTINAAGALAFGYDDADGAASGAASSNGATGSTSYSLVAAGRTLAGSFSANSFGWRMRAARFGDKVIGVMVSSGTGLTLTPSSGTERASPDVSNIGMYVMDILAPLAAEAGAQSSVSVSMSVISAVSASVGGQSSTAATMYRVASIDLGEVSAVSTVSASIQVQKPLSATVSAVSTVDASLSGAVVAELAPTVAAVSDVSVSLSRAAHRDTEAACTSSVSVSMSVVRAFSATAAGSGAITITLTAVSGAAAPVRGLFAAEHRRAYAAVKAASERDFSKEHARATAALRRLGL